MKRIIFFCLILTATVLSAQTADTLDFSMPQFANPIYDSYSRNYLSTSAMGRANTGVALQGGTEHVLLNPAGYLKDKPALYLEMLIKPPVGFDTAEGEDSYSSPIPFGIIGTGASLGGGFTAAALYSMPKTLKLDDFSVRMNMGAYLLQRYPTFNLHQLTANLAYHRGPWHIGANLHNQIYYLGDFTVLRTFERINRYKYVPRPQFGLLYTSSSANAGITFQPEQDLKWDMKYVEYDAVLPMEVTAGVTAKTGATTINFDIGWENTAAIHPAFKDRVSTRIGVETRVRKFSYRLGYQYVPEVWHGTYRLPMNTFANADTSLWWDFEPVTGNVEEGNQHFLHLGTTWHHRDGSISLAFMQDVAGETRMTQIGLSLQLYFNAFRRKGFLFFG
jgi:hypothetical protein